MKQWIKCSERLPNNAVDVTVYSIEHGVVNGYYWREFSADGKQSKTWFVCCGVHEGAVSDITHWQPLPEPPTN